MTLSPQAAFLKELEASLADCPAGGLTMELRFRDQPWWDSLAALTLLAVFDSTFGKPLPIEDFMKCQTIADVCRQA
jgi:acyl carrier protein